MLQSFSVLRIFLSFAKVVECSIIYDNAEIKVLSLHATDPWTKVGLFFPAISSLFGASHVPNKLKTFLYVVAS